MVFSIKLHTRKSGWFIVYIEGSQFKKNIVFLFLKIDFVLANSADSDEISHYVAFHLGLLLFAKYQFRVFWSTKYYWLSIIHFQHLLKMKSFLS